MTEAARRDPEPLQGRIITREEASEAGAGEREGLSLESITWDGKALTYTFNGEWRG